MLGLAASRGGEMADRAHYQVPILESASGYESSRTVVFAGTDSHARVLDRIGLTFDSIRATTDAVAEQAIHRVYEEDFRSYQGPSSPGGGRRPSELSRARSQLQLIGSPLEVDTYR
jgi:hypothetical protein